MANNFYGINKHPQYVICNCYKIYDIVIIIKRICYQNFKEN